MGPGLVASAFRSCHLAGELGQLLSESELSVRAGTAVSLSSSLNLTADVLLDDSELSV